MASIEGKIAKACKDMKCLYGMREEKVKAAWSRLLRLYGEDWGFIYENNYEALFECCMMEDEQEQEKEQKPESGIQEKSFIEPGREEIELKTVEVLSDDGPEGNSEPLLNDEPSTSIWAKKDEAAVVEVKEPVQLSNKRDRASSCCETDQDIKGKKPAIAETAGGRVLDIVNNEAASVTQRNALNLDLNSYPELSPEGLSLAVIHPAVGVLDATQMEIVSSKKGEVKLSLIYNSLVKNFAKVPNLDVFLKVAEDKIGKKYGITDPKFSMKKIMRDLCECFLEMGTNVSNVPHLLSKFDVPKKLESQGHTNGKDYDKSNSSNHPSCSNVDDCNYKVVNLPLNFPKNPIFVEDITRGEEEQPISLINNNGALELPKFIYISKNTIYKNAYVNFSLARIGDGNCCSNCYGDCLSAPANCACTSETRGDFAYTAAGVLQEKFLMENIAISTTKAKEHFYYCENCPLENGLLKSSKNHKRKRSVKPCKGHMMRKFIKECWAKCGCNRNCGNRVVQRGITAKLQVFQTSDGRGWGVRTLEALEKGSFVCEYVGEIVTNQELAERNEEFSGDRHTYPVLLDADWASERHLDEEALCLDATKFGNVARFINHRCYDANLIEIPVEIETPDHHYYHLAFFTSRKVEVNEELNWDYGIDFTDENHPIKAFDCKCGSIFCSMKFQS